MIKDERWPVARLIPISSATGIEAQERRAASALLSVLSAVDEFGRALLKPLGAPTGKIETFIEIPFKLDGRSIRPDGIITVSRGGKIWAAIVEVKTSSSLLEREQVDTYLDYVQLISDVRESGSLEGLRRLAEQGGYRILAGFMPGRDLGALDDQPVPALAARMVAKGVGAKLAGADRAAIIYGTGAASRSVVMSAPPASGRVTWHAEWHKPSPATNW